MGALTNYGFGTGGVNLVKDPLELAENEATSLQNAEIVLDEAKAGHGAITKRAGLAALTSALSGSVLGMMTLPMLTTYTRTLYVSKGQEDTTSFVTTTDGTTLANSTSARDIAIPSNFTDANGTRDARRMTSFRNLIVYPGNGYTKNTTNPEISVWDGTTGSLVTSIPVGPSSNGSPPYAISDMITANGKIYFGVHDPGGSAPSLAGRVMSLDLESGVVKQIATAFGNGTNQMTGGYPSALCWYQNQLFVGLNGSSTTNGIGKIVRCFPDVDTTWTSDVSNLVSHISSLAIFLGDLYAGTQSSTSTNAKVYKRTLSTGAWTAVETSTAAAAGGDGHYGSLWVHASTLYAVEYYSGATDILHIRSTTDGTTWATSRDVDANDGPADPPQFPAGVTTLGSDLLYVFRAVSDSSNDGFIMRLRSGTWSKLATDNYAGPLAILVTRS